ncbi:hypothetical protein [Halobacillus sp. B29]|uniref:hypothetical protein n=1 Tax=Halobacillus sp. B29 TaxID=3457432 RepID=UPI003FCCB5F1
MKRARRLASSPAGKRVVSVATLIKFLETDSIYRETESYSNRPYSLISSLGNLERLTVTRKNNDGVDYRLKEMDF